MELIDEIAYRIERLEARYIKHLEKNEMADFTKLKTDIADLSAKVDKLIALINTPPAPPVDEQPEVDAADAEINAIAAKIPNV